MDNPQYKFIGMPLKEPLVFAQLFCLLIGFSCLICIMVCFFALINRPEIVKDPTATTILVVIITAIITGFAKCYGYITNSSASAQAKDEVQAKANDKMIDAVANSTPTPKP